MSNKEKKETGFNRKLYILGAIIIVAIGTAATYFELQIKGTDSALISAKSATFEPTKSITKSVVETAVEHITATVKPTEKATQKPTDKPTEKVTERTAKESIKKPIEKPTKAEKKAEKPTVIVPIEPEQRQSNEPEIVYVPIEQPNNNNSNSALQQPSQIIEKPTQLQVLLPQYTEQDIVLSQSVVYISKGSTANVEVIFPAGLTSNGVEWKLENSLVVGFNSANFNTAVLSGKSQGTTTVYANPKGYNITLQCTVVVT